MPKERKSMFPTPATSYAPERERLLREAETQDPKGHLFKLCEGEKRGIYYEGAPLEVMHGIQMLRKGLESRPYAHYQKDNKSR